MLIKTLLEEFYYTIQSLEIGVIRKTVLLKVPHKIKVIIGMRRVGKTHFLLQHIKKKIEENPSMLTRILYLNFEDDRLLPLTASTLGQLLDSFYTLYPENHDQSCIFVLDEIQNIPEWEITLRRFFDTKNVDIYLTGSSAKLLSKEIATSLRGRSLATEMWPLSFVEYLSYHHIDYPKKPFGKMTQDKLFKHFKAYLKTGGFPEIQRVDLLTQLSILQNYVDTVIFRDIIERYHISNTVLIKYMVKKMMAAPGTLFSINKFYHDLKSQGFHVSKATLHDYLSYLEDAYLIFPVPLYSESIRKVQTNPKKIYVIDTGLIAAYKTSFSDDLGHIFENCVYIELRRRGFEVYYYLTSERYEVDFLAKDIHNQLFLFQVVWDMTDDTTREREKRALEAAEKELKIKGTIITPEYFLRW